MNARRREAVSDLQPRRLPAAGLLRKDPSPRSPSTHPDSSHHILSLRWTLFYFYRTLFHPHLCSFSTTAHRYVFLFLLEQHFKSFSFFMACGPRVAECFHYSAQHMMNTPAVVEFCSRLLYLQPSLLTVCQEWIQKEIRVRKGRSDPDHASRSEPFVMATTPALCSKATHNCS